MLGGISIWQLLIVLAIIIMIFGTKKLRSLGGDLGGAVKGFKKAMNEDPDDGKNAKDEDDTPKSISHEKKQADADFEKVKDQDKS